MLMLTLNETIDKLTMESSVCWDCHVMRYENGWREDGSGEKKHMEEAD